MRALALAVLLVGCAKAGAGGNNPIDGNGSGDPDGNNVVDDTELPDTPPSIDAPVAVTMAETTASTVVSGASLACSNTATHYTRTNSYYRIFTLTDFGVAGKFFVSQVSFAVEQATAGGGATSQAAQMKIGTYDIAPVGTTLDLTKITPINSANIMINNGTSTLVNVPITATIPAGTNMIVELAIPDGNAVGNIFFLGANNAGESKPGYIRGPDCNLTSPATLASVAAGAGVAVPNIVMAVTGTH